MQIESVATKAGVAICAALSSTTSSRSFSGSAFTVTIDILDLDCRVIDQEFRPPERAHPSVMDIDRLAL